MPKLENTEISFYQFQRYQSNRVLITFSAALQRAAQSTFCIIREMNSGLKSISFTLTSFACIMYLIFDLVLTVIN